jgi:anti-anti-sigma factor
MDIASRREGRGIVVSLGGSIDALGGPEITVYLSKEIDSGNDKLVLDMASVTFISSAGVRMILNAVKMARQSGGDVYLAALPRNIYKVLELGGIIGSVKSFDDVSTASLAFPV